MKLTASKAITKDIDNYLGRACILKYLLNNNYEIEVHMPADWNMKTLPVALKDSYIEPPVSIHLLSIDVDNKLLN